jgi:hypothetical protein
VPVPVDNGYHEAPHPIDLKYELYISVDQDNHRIVDLDCFMVQYPLAIEQGASNPVEWTIFLSESVSFISIGLHFLTFANVDMVEGSPLSQHAGYFAPWCEPGQ